MKLKLWIVCNVLIMAMHIIFFSHQMKIVIALVTEIVKMFAIFLQQYNARHYVQFLM